MAASAAARERARLMDLALAEAGRAGARGEVPIGCVLADASGAVVGAGGNRATETGDASAHAELVAFRALGAAPRAGLTLAVTCEPCVMCAAAIVATGAVREIVYGCSNPRFGGCGSVRALHQYVRAGNGSDRLPVVAGGVKAAEAIALLEGFYAQVNPNAPRPAKRHKQA